MTIPLTDSEIAEYIATGYPRQAAYDMSVAYVQLHGRNRHPDTLTDAEWREVRMRAGR